MARPQQASTTTVLGRFATATTRGLTLIECLIAIVILAAAVLAVNTATTVGHQHLQQGDEILSAVQLADELMDEILSKPYEGTVGGSRSAWHMDDYNGFTQAIGAMTDFSGAPCDKLDFASAVTVVDSSPTVTALESATIPGKVVTITISDADGEVFELARFVTETTS